MSKTVKRVLLFTLSLAFVICASFSLRNVSSTKLAMAEGEFEMKSTSLYLPSEDEGFGIRFTASIDDIDAEYNMVIAPFDYFVSAGVTFDGTEDYVAKLETLDKPNKYVLGNNIYKDVETGEASFSLTGVLGNNIDRDFLGIAYKVVGGEKVYADVDASDKMSICLLASKFVNAYNASSEKPDGLEDVITTLQSIVIDSIKLNLPGEAYALDVTYDNRIYKGDVADITTNLPERLQDRLSVLYYSSNGSIVTIENGKLVGTGNGKATITANLAGVYIKQFDVTCGLTIGHPNQSPQATYHSLTRSEMTEDGIDAEDVRDDVWKYTITVAPNSTFENRMNLSANAGESIRYKWLAMEVYFTEYSANELTLYGLYGGNNYGSFSGFGAYGDFKGENVRLFDKSGNALTSFAKADILNKWITVATKIDKMYSDDGKTFNSFSFSLFNYATGSCYVDEAKFYTEDEMVEMFEEKTIVEYYQQNAQKAYDLVDTETLDKVYGETATVTPDAPEGYVLNNSLSVLSTKVGVGVNVLKVYYDLPNKEIVWEKPNGTNLTVGGSETGRFHALSFTAATMTGPDAKDGVYKFVYSPKEGGFTTYQGNLTYSVSASDPVQDLRNYWVVFEVYVDNLCGSALNLKIRAKYGGWGDIASPQYKVFDLDGKEITDLSSANVTGKWLRIAFKQEQQSATTNISVAFANGVDSQGASGKGNVFYVSQVAKLNVDDFALFFNK